MCAFVSAGCPVKLVGLQEARSKQVSDGDEEVFDLVGVLRLSSRSARQTLQRTAPRHSCPYSILPRLRGPSNRVRYGHRNHPDGGSIPVYPIDLLAPIRLSSRGHPLGLWLYG